MLTIRDSVESTLRSDRVAREALERGVMNLSEYARLIREKISLDTKKNVGIQSIVVTLSRLEKVMKREKSAFREVEVQQLAVQAPIVQLVYPRNPSTTEQLLTAIEQVSGLGDAFFSVSTSTKDIAVLVSERITESVKSAFAVPPYVEKHGLSAVSVRFSEKLVREANVGLLLLEKLAGNEVVLDAALTTYNEFTLLFENKYLERVIATLTPKK